jgi:hypothetical protein
MAGQLGPELTAGARGAPVLPPCVPGCMCIGHSRPDVVPSLWVEEPEVSEVLDLWTGAISSHQEVIGQDHGRALTLLDEVQASARQKDPRFLCPMCGAPLQLATVARRSRFFFRHPPRAASGCANLRRSLTASQVAARLHLGAKASRAHLLAKKSLARCLEADPRFTDIEVTARDVDWEAGTWHHADVTARIDEMPVAFEILLSARHLHPVLARRPRFRERNTLLVWVFARLEPSMEAPALDDIYFNETPTALMLSEETVQTTLRRREFMVECLWAESQTGADIEAVRRTLIPFHSLTLDARTQRFVHVEGRGKPYRPWRERFEAFWTSLDLRSKLSPEQYAQWRSLEREGRRRVGVRLPPHPLQEPRVLLDALYSAKLGRPVGWRFDKLVEVARLVSQVHPHYLQALRRAFDAYGRGPQLLHEDASGRWRRQVRLYQEAMARRDPSFLPDDRFDDLVDALFPELDWSGYRARLAPTAPEPFPRLYRPRSRPPLFRIDEPDDESYQAAPPERD